jgi:translation initiation factor IF-3
LSLNREGRVPIIAILLDVGKYIYKSTVKLKEMALPQKLKVKHAHKIIYISVSSKSIGNIQNYEALEGVYCLLDYIEII